MPSAAVLVTNDTGVPVSSVPVRVTATPARPDSALSMRPLLLLSAYTRPATWAGGSSPKLLSAEVCVKPSVMALMLLGVLPAPLAVPPLLPATVRPFKVPPGCAGSVTV